MSERRCPKCGAAVWARGRDYAIYECESEAIEGEDLEEATQCLRNQLSQAKERIEELAQERDTLRAKLDELLSQRMDEAEAKLATRPAEAVVGELQAENRRLREALEIAKRYVVGPHPNYGLDRVRDDYGIIEQALEVQGCWP